MRFFCDRMRHLVCVPYTVENLHEMARELSIKRCWFHASSRYPHYDIPKRRIAEVSARCTVVSPRDVLKIMKRQQGPDWVPTAAVPAGDTSVEAGDLRTERVEEGLVTVLVGGS